MATGKLFFAKTLTVEQFKALMLVDKITVKKNPKNGNKFIVYGSKVGACRTAGIPEHPMLSLVCPEGDTIDEIHAGEQNCTTFWLLHEEGNGGAPTLATF